MAEKKQPGKAGRKPESGNVVVDLGEKMQKRAEKLVDQKLQAAGLTSRMAGKAPAAAAAPYRAGSLAGQRAGAFGGYRPWYSRFGKPWMGQGETYAPSRSFQLIPESLRQVTTTKLVGGLAAGLVGNRAIVRVTPLLWKSQNQRWVHEGLAAVLGLVPVLWKTTPMTLGVAIPGILFFGATIIDKIFDMVHIPKASLSGPGPSASQGAGEARAVRERLATIQTRINQPAGLSGQRPLPQVVARQYA